MGEDGRRGGTPPRVASFSPTLALGKDVVDDARHMARALELAERGWGAASPNPMVGAVLVRDGEIVGEGWYRGPGAGHPHAEINALAMAGVAASGATLYCTLEPCDHVGHTPPCTRALIAAGIRRAVVAASDPNPIVDGRGIARLREAGIDVARGPLTDEARRLNEAFEHAVTTGRPLVTLKMAATLDGKVAARDGSSRWITGEAARADAHRLRAGADAIVIGAGTALADDPSLTVRDGSYAGLPVPRVIVDAAGRVPATGRAFDNSAPTIVATTERSGSERREEWLRAGAEVLVLDESDGGVALEELLSTLGKRDVQAVLLEGGPSLAWSAVAGGLVHKLVLYLAPVLAGGSAAPGILGGEGFAPIGSAGRVRIDRIGRVGDDIRVEAHVHRDR